jgi:hypothetical protein
MRNSQAFNQAIEHALIDRINSKRRNHEGETHLLSDQSIGYGLVLDNSYKYGIHQGETY